MTPIIYPYKNEWTTSKCAIEEDSTKTNNSFDSDFPFFLELKWESFNDSVTKFAEAYTNLLVGMSEKEAKIKCHKLSPLFMEILRTATEIFDILNKKSEILIKRNHQTISQKDRTMLNKIKNQLRNKSAILNNRVKHNNRKISTLTVVRHKNRERYFCFLVLAVSRLKKISDQDFHKKKVEAFSYIKWVDEIIANLYEADEIFSKMLQKYPSTEQSLIEVRMINRDFFWMFHSLPKLISDGESNVANSIQDFSNHAAMTYSQYIRPPEGMQFNISMGKARKGEMISITGRTKQ